MESGQGRFAAQHGAVLPVTPAVRYGWVLAWAAVVLTTYAVRGPVPIDETRYLSVAWEMWQRGSFLVPHLNGHPYSDKPPLLFWLFSLGWWATGVSQWWPRLVPPLFSLAALVLTGAIARRLWPGRTWIAAAAPWVVAGSFFWAGFTGATMFDMPLAGFAALALWALLRAGQDAPGEDAFGKGWTLFAVSCGLGILTKGPVMLLHVAFPALLAPWWSAAARRRPVRWYGALAAALAAGAVLALAWALPAAEAGGPGYAQAILWHQTAGRVAQSFAHQRPWWWYLPLLPVLLFPWLLWPRLWRALGGLGRPLDPGVRFCLLWLVPTFAAFWLVSGKQPHYLLPLFPGFALLAARALDGRSGEAGARPLWLPGAVLVAVGGLMAAVPYVHARGLPTWAARVAPLWGVVIAAVGVSLALRLRPSGIRSVMALALGTVAAVVLLYGALFQAGGAYYDLRPAARAVARLQQQGRPVAFVGDYNGEFQFLGRLEHPLAVLSPRQVAVWTDRHPRGEVVVTDAPEPPARGPAPTYSQPYERDWLVIWPAPVLHEHLSLTP